MIMDESVAQVCSGCGHRILDRYYLLAVDRQWHNDCLKCTICGMVLGNHLTCFARDGEIYCRDDYARRYSVNGSHRSASANGGDFGGHGGQHHPPHEGRCGRCGNSIGSQELVMRAKDLVFHLHCFVCVICLRVLNKGDHFGMRSSALYCAEHFELIEPRPPSPSPNYFNGAGTGQKGRPRKRNKEPTELGSLSLNTPCGDLLGTPPSESSVGGVSVLRLVEASGGGGYESSSSSCPGGAGGQRTKRMRTSFKHHQLRTMKSYFGINQNPDAKDLKQLAQKTGLSKRVLQVWFQNARAKWRRNTMRSDSGGPRSGGGSGGTTPTHHDSDLGQSTSSQDLLLGSQLPNGLLSGGPGSGLHHSSSLGGGGGGLSDTEGGFSNDIY